MGILRQEIDGSAKTVGRKHRLDQIIKSMCDEDAADLQTALDDHSVPQASIVRALRARNISVSQSVISNYRTGVS